MYIFPFATRDLRLSCSSGWLLRLYFRHLPHSLSGEVLNRMAADTQAVLRSHTLVCSLGGRSPFSVEYPWAAPYSPRLVLAISTSDGYAALCHSAVILSIDRSCRRSSEQAVCTCVESALRCFVPSFSLTVDLSGYQLFS